MAEEPDGNREPNLELPQLRLPGFRRTKVRRGRPAGESQAPPPPLAEPEPDPETDTSPLPLKQPEPDPEADTPPLPLKEPEGHVGARRNARARLPVLPGPVAAAVAGVVVGASGTGATYGGLRGCEAVNGAPSCGASGLGLLVAIAIGMVALGALILRAFRVREPWGASLLGVGIVVVVVLLGLTTVIFSGWMFLAIPLLTAAAYAFAHWVTTRFVEPMETPPGPDVR